MAKLVGKKFRFLPSDSSDVVDNKLYVEPYADPSNLTYDSPSYSVGNTPETDGYIYVDLMDYVNVEGNYDIGIAAVDDVGNEADMQKLLNVPLDLKAPNPVGSLELL